MDQTGSIDEISVKPVSPEEAFSRQNDRIATLRSMGLPWGEAVFELRDQLEGLEDGEFWDGIPPKIRKQMVHMAPGEQRRTRDAYRERGWSTYTIRAYRHVTDDGDIVPVYDPSPEQLSRALRIVRSLAARKGITWRVKTKSWLGYGSMPDHLKEAHHESQ